MLLALMAAMPALANPITKYVEMSPAFITHIGEPAIRLSYARAELSLRVSSDAAAEAVRTHMPQLRHAVLMLMAEPSVDALSGSEGQDALRLRIMEALNEVLASERTEATIDDVLFTTFVVQR